MKIVFTIPFFIIGVLAIGLSFNEATAEIGSNNVFILEGSGFAVTEDSIKTTEIDFAMSTGDKTGSRTNILIEDGFVTLNEGDFIVTDLTGTALRDDRFIRISGTIEDSLGDEASFRVFGRLIQNSDEGAVYGFTGRLTYEGEEHKIIYTTKLSELTSTSLIQKTSIEETSDDILIHILPGSSSQGIALNYIEIGEIRKQIVAITGDSSIGAKYFFPDRISIEPGTTITFVNDDDTSHRMVSGTGLGQHSSVLSGDVVICETLQEDLPEGFSYAGSGCDFSFDGRIDSGSIEPGDSWTGTLDEVGLYRIIDPSYPWMTVVIYSFPDTGSKVIQQTRTGAEQSGN
jgi:plastocyanin